MTMQQDRYPYGSVKAAVREWIEGLPVGREFHYTEIADELDIARASVSGIILKMARLDPEPLIVFGKRAAWYTRVEPRLRPELEAESRRLPAMTIDTGRKAPEPREPHGPRADDVMAVIGIKKDGVTVILRDEEGSLWEASPV